jgi:hypothetical protein
LGLSTSPKFIVIKEEGLSALLLLSYHIFDRTTADILVRRTTTGGPEEQQQQRFLSNSDIRLAS